MKIPCYLLFLLSHFFTAQLYAQGSSASVVKSGLSDANKIFGAYLSPMLTGWSSGLNNNWYTTAKPHGLGGFDITVSAGGFFVPEHAMTYNPNNLKLENAQPSPGVNSMRAPTIFGSPEAGPKMDVFYHTPVKDFAVGSFNLPAGTGYYFFPSIPNIQLNFGVIKNTELMVRFIPNVNLHDIQSHVYGIGIKHDLKQWITGIKKTAFDFSGVAAYSITGAEYLIPEVHRLYPDDNSYPGAQQKSFYDNQRFGMQTNAWLLAIVLSKKMKFFTPYAGFSYNHTFIRFKVLGNYPMPVYEPLTSPIKPTIKNVNDPITLEVTDNAMRLNIGARIKFYYTTIHFEYTIARFNTITAGLGFNLQSLHPFVR
ncbi:MAG: hypothetical protein H7296_02600 [Bacteroidia bacterium]|nr:hypothetical protein [Bacteroidia bacterium]